MITELRSYPAMKGSGVPWLGAIPEHWEIMPICALARRRQQTNQQQRELLSVYLGRGVVPFSSVDEKRTNPTSEDLSKYQAVEPGDFVLNNQQAWRGSVGVSRYKGIVSPAYLVLALDGRLKQEYADRLLSAPAMVTQYLVSSKGVGSIQRNLYWPHLKRVAVLVPPSTEQTAIVRFLDHADRKIRRYIRVKQKLIKLLEEQKQVVIQRAVTRGLDPNVRFKPSGVEWLGDVPEHWKVIPTRHLFRQVTRQDIKGDEPKMSMSRRLGLVRSEELKTRAATAASSVAFSVCHVGDLVMNKYQAHNGLFGCATERGLITANYSVFCPCAKAQAAYFSLLYTSPAYKAAFLVSCRGVGDGMMPLYSNAFGRVPSLVPPPDEQLQIAEHIRESLDSLRTAVSRVDHEIELIREYRTRLIADVVTGKLDVRGAAAQLPDEDQELRPIDESDEISNDEQDGFDDLDEGTEEPEP